MLNRLRTRTESGDTLLDISLEVDRQSISQHPVGTGLCHHPVSMSALVLRLSLVCVTTCLPNSTSVIYMAACNPDSVRRGTEDCLSYLVLHELLLVPTCLYSSTADPPQTWQLVIFRICLFLCFESHVYFLSISNLLLLFLCNFSEISGVIGTVKPTSFSQYLFSPHSINILLNLLFVRHCAWP